MHGITDPALLCVNASLVQTLPDVYSVQQRHFEYTDPVGKMQAIMGRSKVAPAFSKTTANLSYSQCLSVVEAIQSCCRQSGPS
uniref:Uncharacterized protein n=1 Tax=Trichuris muris TaxID=70415 RepID=A0A5S6Q2H9_TRIMR